MLARDVAVLELRRLLLGGSEDAHQVLAALRGRALHGRQAAKFGLGDLQDAGGIDACLREDRGGDGLPFLQHRGKQMKRRNLAVTGGVRGGLGGGDRLLSKGGESIESHEGSMCNRHAVDVGCTPRSCHEAVGRRSRVADWRRSAG